MAEELQGSDDLLNLTVRELLEIAKQEGNQARGKGIGHGHFVENEYGRTEITVLVGLGPYAEELEAYHETAAPGVTFRLNPDYAG